MKIATSPLLLQAASGKTISTAQIVSDSQDVHGVLLVFTDGTELSIDFRSPNVNAEVRHYRWGEDGEANTIDLK